MESTVNSNLHQSAFHPFIRSSSFTENVKYYENKEIKTLKEPSSDDEVDVETTEEDTVFQTNRNNTNIVSNTVSESSCINTHSMHQHCWSPPRETVSNMDNKSCLFRIINSIIHYKIIIQIS